ncbi:MAG: phytanoyl-CoA dioxygenase family protein [Phycisphaeraceae bacterium]|nr:phytanoyl-CoA dioxygenase family protein [Phycisphaeraceae bacterium]
MLSPEQIQQYQDDGYTCVHDLFDPAQIDALEEAFDGIIDRRLANRAKMDATWGGEKWRQKYDNGGGRTTILVTHDVQAYDAAWSRALLHPPLTEALSDCMGSPNVQLHHTKLFQKPPEKGSAFPMHQDYPYFPHENHSMMAAVIYLSDATDEMGCFRVYPGSHKNGPMTPDEGNHLDPDQWPIEKATPLPVRRGDVLLFN